ncbi:MAG: DUF937 domain-containing protein [Rhodobacteraceae bacterium]|nr:DUF937 domain-containing protein [Paracoccaceae bacterium]
MSLINLLAKAQGGQGLSQLANQFGLDEKKASELSGLLAPAIGSAAKKRAASGGLGDVLGALKGEGQGGLFDDAAQAAAPEGQAQGMAFLEQLMGGKQGTEGLAGEAANRTGVDIGTIMKFLPAMAAMLQGGMQKNLPDNSIDAMMSSDAGGSAGGLGGLVSGLMGGGDKSAGGLGALTQLLDADGDGSPLDDIMSKFMK